MSKTTGIFKICMIFLYLNINSLFVLLKFYSCFLQFFFHFRCWVLLDSHYNVFLFREGVLRTASEPYNPSDYNDVTSHLTNHSLQKDLSKMFGFYEEGNEMFFDEFDRYVDLFFLFAFIFSWCSKFQVFSVHIELGFYGNGECKTSPLDGMLIYHKVHASALRQVPLDLYPVWPRAILNSSFDQWHTCTNMYHLTLHCIECMTVKLCFCHIKILVMCHQALVCPLNMDD